MILWYPKQVVKQRLWRSCDVFVMIMHFLSPYHLLSKTMIHYTTYSATSHHFMIKGSSNGKLIKLIPIRNIKNVLNCSGPKSPVIDTTTDKPWLGISITDIEYLSMSTMILDTIIAYITYPDQCAICHSRFTQWWIINAPWNMRGNSSVYWVYVYEIYHHHIRQWPMPCLTKTWFLQKFIKINRTISDANIISDITTNLSINIHGSFPHWLKFWYNSKSTKRVLHS